MELNEIFSMLGDYHETGDNVDFSKGKLTITVDASIRRRIELVRKIDACNDP
ncbi:MAG: hypothetical protein IBX69_11285 [Anaerolineales bacterium]|nr:hypothetical protein [Anaerolineales bacterium]